jgi:hypothetical protein
MCYPPVTGIRIMWPNFEPTNVHQDFALSNPKLGVEVSQLIGVDTENLGALTRLMQVCCLSLFNGGG